jgi:hypothetical protein
MRDPKDITVNGKQLSEILEAHRKWLRSEEGGERADLSYADLRDADLRDAKNIEMADAITRILPEGDIIGWKKCNDDVIVKLLIPADAKRSNATGRKCRAEFAKVIEVIGAEYGVTDSHGPTTKYLVDETVRPDKWDDNRWDECSNGIHFFITRYEAEQYT